MTMLQHALAYRAAGFSVFPCHAGTKDPHVKWKALQETPASVAQIEAWWKMWPNANIACVTGRVSGFVIVDIDTQHNGVVDGLPPPLWSVRTPRGGRHYYYSYPEGADRVRNQVNSEKCKDPERVGRDVRGDGGYVLLPPSKRGEGVYSGNRDALDTTVVRPPPAWALKPIEKDEDPNDNKESHWITKTLVEGPADGERNNTIAKLAGYLESKNVATDIAVVMLQQFDERQKNPLGAEEVEVTARSVYRTAYRNKPISEKKIDPEAFEVLAMREYMERYGSQDVKWTVEDWLPAETIAMAVAPPGSYKTWLTFDLAISVATGLPFMDVHPIGAGCRGPVLIVQQEDFHGQIAERISVISMHKHGMRLQHDATVADDECSVYEIASAPDCPLYFYPHRDLRFSDERKMDGLEAWIDKIKPSLMLFDPMYSGSKSLESFMSEDIADMMRFKKFRDTYHMSTLFVHHTKKGSASFNRERGWGSQFLNAFCETVWGVAKPEGEDFRVVVKPNFKMAPAGSLTEVKFEIHTDERWMYKPTLRRISEEESDSILQVEAEQRGRGQPTRESGPQLDLFNVLAKGPATKEAIALALATTPEKVTQLLRPHVRKGLIVFSDSGDTYELQSTITMED